MAIVETKLKVRPTANVEFFNSSGNVEITNMRNTIQSLFDAGKVVQEKSYPDTVGNLQLQEINTFDNLDTFGQVDTAKGIPFDKAFMDWYDTHDYSHPAEPTIANVHYTLTGINSSFYVTTAYNFSTENDYYIPIMTQSLEIAYDHKGKLADMVVTSNSITVVHQYNNDTDFVDTHYKDLLAYVPQLAEKNATRTITYTAGTYSK
jgi:hypothetical protein